MSYLSLVPLALLSAIQLQPASVPATGSQTSILTLAAPEMVRISAKSGPGTACTVVDKVRGPFTASGKERSCDLDLMLDAGSYKLRLESPIRGKGQVAISARAFPETNAKPVRLDKGRRVEQVLRSGEKASFWLSLSAREVPFLRLMGKNAGEVRLWKNGDWLEPVNFAHSTFAAGQSRVVHEWHLEELLEAGEYLVTAYGTSTFSGTASEATDALTVDYGFEPLPPERTVAFTLPATGTLAFQSPKGRGAFLATLDTPSASAFELSAGDLLSPSYLGLTATAEKPLPSERGLPTKADFTLEPKKLVPQASVTATSDEVHVATLRGAPGTRGVLEWAPAPSNNTWAGGYYGTAERSLAFQVDSPGDYLIGLHDLPADTDSAPLGCQLQRPTQKSVEVVARDVLTIGDGQQIERDFNYDGKNAIVWFAVTRSARYRLQTLGDRKNRCEVWRVDSHGELDRLTQTKPEANSCSETLALSAGVYQLSLYDGISGIEKLSIREDSQRALKPVPAKAGCLIVAKGLDAGRYVLAVSRAGDLAARGLVLQALPLALLSPVHLVLDPGRTLTLPVAQAGVARSAASKPFGCNGKSAGGQCPLGVGALTLENPSAEVVLVTLLRPTEPKPVPALLAFDPKAVPLPKATLDQTVYFDFEREQSHSLVFEVDKPGLYNVTTLGLLGTQCRLRTPVVPDVAHDVGSGRGRNCLVSGYLRPGRYMLTATSTGTSRGRAGLVMTRRPPREYAAVRSESESFFRVAAGELVQQKLVVPTAGELSLSTTGQGVTLQCRLDDAEGWPLEKVPTDCTQTRPFQSGTYLWTQLPLTVESMRRTKLGKVKEPLVLKGNSAHPVAFHTWYTAQLGSDGKDDFLFKLEDELDLDIVLTFGMQGRIYLLEPGKPPRPMEVIPPQKQEPSESAGQPAASHAEQGSADSESKGDAAGAAGFLNGEEGASDGDRRGERTGEGDESAPAAAPAADAPLQAQQAPPPPSGVKLSLPRGQYKLVTEHSRGDVGVEYKLHLGSEVMLPGMARDLPVPVVVAVKMPKDGTLRLRTEGEADVRCRLFAGDRLLFEGAKGGSDWNCALAEPLVAGTYRLVLESETQRPGATRLALALAPVEDGGLIKDGVSRTLADAVQTLALPTAGPDAVQEVSFRGKSPFSCALEDGSGQVVHRLTRVTECALLVRPQSERFKVRVWTTDGAVQLTQSFHEKSVTAAGRGTLPAAQASLVLLARAGRYSTSPQIWCLAGSARGLLRPCGPEASLAAGATVFAAFGSKDQPLPLAEQFVATGAPATQALALSQTPWLQTLTAPQPSIFLLSGEVEPGQREAPACAFDTGVRESRPRTCFAVSSASAAAVARAWAPVGLATPLWTQLTRRAIALPAPAGTLSLGRAHLSLSGEATLLALPARGRSRLELTLPGDAWAVLFDDAGRTLDFCAPVGRAETLARCVVVGQGGKLLLSSSEAQADITTVQLDAPERSRTFTSLYEDAPRRPGSLRLTAPAADSDRMAQVEGEVRCTFVYTDGSRVSGCQAPVPKGVGIELQLEHGTGPLRAMVYGPGNERRVRLGIELPAVAGPVLPAAVAVPILGATGSRIDRTLVLDKDTVVRITADSGVCGLFHGSELLAVEGMDAGCELVRLVAAGTYRVVSRPFAGHHVPATLRWTAEPVSTLGEGVAPEDWLAPAEVRVYRFSTAGKGFVGLGLQTRVESLDCSIYDSAHKLLGDGCQQYLQLDKGNYLLTVRLPALAGAQPLRIRPVLLGLAGAKAAVPTEYLKDLFRRIGESQ